MAEQTSLEKKNSSVTQVERARSGRAFVPSVDIIEKSDELIMFADVPGAAAQDIDVNFEKGQLTIHAKVDPRQDEENTQYLLQEFGVGDFCRTFQIGDGVNPERIKAEVRDGVLKLHLPKSETLKPRKIAVRTA